MPKDTQLLNIYIKIHNKENLTMDDLRYLAKYAPECFEKTCKNVVYNFPETKHIVDPDHHDSVSTDTSSIVSEKIVAPAPVKNFSFSTKTSKKDSKSLTEESYKIEKILNNLKNLKTKDFPTCNVTLEEVRNLLGNLYMELLFPHNDKDTFLHIDGPFSPFFDRKI